MSAVLAKQRQSMILEHVRRSGGVRVSELTELLGVSDMTVRRDLDVLARHNLIEKVHGGATVASAPSMDEPGFVAKSSRELSEKEAIAAAAARLVRPGTAIALSGGTTTFALAQRITHVRDLTIVTNSIRVIDVLQQAPGAPTVILTGGIRTPSDALVGPVADLAIRSLHFDIFFLGCHGMDPHAGLTTPNLAESETNRAFIRGARQVVLLADHTKWGTVGLSSFADLDEADVLITDPGLSDDARATASEHIDRVIVAGTRAGQRSQRTRRRPPDLGLAAATQARTPARGDRLPRLEATQAPTRSGTRWELRSSARPRGCGGAAVPAGPRPCRPARTRSWHRPTPRRCGGPGRVTRTNDVPAASAMTSVNPVSRTRPASGSSPRKS